MSVNPFGSAIPNGGPPLSFISGASNVPSGPGPEYGRKIRPVDMGAPGTHTHLPNGEWTITHDYMLTPTPQLNYHLMVHDHQMLWHNKAARSTLQGQQTQMFLPHFAFNDVCRRGWRLAVSHLSGLMELNEGTLVPTATSKDDLMEKRENYLNFLKLPEVQWSTLYSIDSTLNQKNDYYKFMYWLTKEGIMERYSPVGAVLVEPQIQYGPTELPRKTNRLQFTVAFEGVMQVTNIWGKRACQGAYLFEILKRVKDPTTGYYGPFASVPYASMEKNVPDEELEYTGVSGCREIGIAFYRGQVIDVLAEPPSDYDLELVQGFRGSADESAKACSHTTKLKILLASASRMS